MIFIDLLFFISNALCFITAGVIFFKINSNKIFGLTILVGYLILNGISNSFYLLIEYGFINYFPYLYKIPAPLTFLIGPAAYLYLRTTLYNETHFKKIDWVHLIPFVVFTVNYLPFYFMPLAEKSALVSKVTEDISMAYLNKDGLLPEWVNLACRALLSIVYIIAQWLLIAAFYKKHPLQSPHFLKVKKWVLVFFRAQLGYWLALLVIYVLNGVVTQYGDGIVPEFISAATLVLMSVFFFTLAAYLLMNPTVMLGLNTMLSIEDNIRNQKNLEEYKKIFKKLHLLITNKKLYLNPLFSVSSLVVETQISRQNISISISDQGYDNFNDYINSLRSEEFISRFISGDFENYSIDAIAENCGFNSKATFYRIFKKKFNCTPTEYIGKLNT